MEDEGGGPRRHQQEHGLPPVPLAVDEHQTHVFEVAQRSGEELHERVGQAVAGQHLHGVFFDLRDAPVEGLGETRTHVSGASHDRDFASRYLRQQKNVRLFPRRPKLPHFNFHCLTLRRSSVRHHK